jgi:hypothetical protein
MTELEQLYFEDKRELTSKIADALKEDDQSFIDKVNQEFSYEYDFQLGVSTYAYTTGDFIVDTLEEATKYYSGELKVDGSDVCWDTLDADDDVDVDRMNARVYGLFLINPSPEAQALINSKQQ